jgi:hypothetical protein
MAHKPFLQPFIPALVVFALSLPVFVRFCALPDLPEAGDHRGHIGAAVLMAREGKWLLLPHPLYHLTILALSAGNLDRVAWSAAVVLALACGVAAGISARYLTRAANPSISTLTLLCLALALAMPLPNCWKFAIFLGQITPNVWHNPTNVFTLPFALGLFVSGLQFLDSPTWSRAGWLGVLALICALAKPNYLLAFVPCLVIAFLAKQRLRPIALVWLLVAFGPVMILIFAQSRLMASYGPKIKLAPFDVWSINSPNPPISALLGLAFPLAVFLTYRERFRGETPSALAWASMFLAIAQFALFEETLGPRAQGNFGWGMVFADHILFLVSCEFLLRQPADGRRRTCFLFLGAHVLVGVYYLTRCMIEPSRAPFF